VRLNRVERYEGRGQLFSGDNALVPARYDLRVFRRMVDNGLGGKIPVLKLMTGSISVADGLV
jgi:hypothetical protein